MNVGDKVKIKEWAVDEGVLEHRVDVDFHTVKWEEDQ